MRVLSLVAALCFLCDGAYADSWTRPCAYAVVSEDGDTILRMVPADWRKKTRSIAEVYRRTSDGTSYQMQKRFSLLNPVAPVRVAVANEAHWVATVDEWGSAGGEYALVVYDQDGQVWRQWRLEELLTPEELDVVDQTKSSRWWAGGVGFVALSEDGECLLVISAPTSEKAGARSRDITIVLSKKRPNEMKDGEPGATDNPDDAQRLREGH